MAANNKLIFVFSLIILGSCNISHERGTGSFTQHEIDSLIKIADKHIDSEMYDSADVVREKAGGLIRA
jgi:hypothetical protein